MDRKMYLAIVKYLHEYIRENGLQPGDKLPSERALSELLGAGRSSVREGLRALELLGIIETRRGEGTFVCNVTEHQLIETIGMFILTFEKSVKDLSEMKFMLEKNSVELTMQKLSKDARVDFSNHCKTILETQMNAFDLNTLFFREFMLKSENQLMLKIWILLTEYIRTTKIYSESVSKENYLEFLQAFIEQNLERCNQIHRQCSSELFS